MAAFTLDTSGVVHVETTYVNAHGEPVPRVYATPYTWDDLTPFTQGALRKVAEEVWEGLDAATREGMERTGQSMAFTDFAPEALAQIIADCERAARLARQFDLWDNGNEADGRRFWDERQTGNLADFPPEIPYLGDDGLIYLRDAA